MMKTPKTLLVISILFIAFTVMEIILSISSSAQNQTADMFRKNGPSQPRRTTQMRDPFLLPPGVYSPSKEGVILVGKEKVTRPEAKIETIEPPPFKVKAILISDRVRLATIGPHIVGVGDKLDDETILEITNDRVILGRGDKKRTLHLQQSPVRLTVETLPPSLLRGEDRRGAEAQDKGGRP